MYWNIDMQVEGHKLSLFAFVYEDGEPSSLGRAKWLFTVDGSCEPVKATKEVKAAIKAAWLYTLMPALREWALESNIMLFWVSNHGSEGLNRLYRTFDSQGILPGSRELWEGTFAWSPKWDHVGL